MKDVREILKKRPLLFDGGMGTYYKAKPGQECEQANLLDPDGILTVHRAYLEAGADAIKTNTFGLPRMAAAQNPMWEAMADEGWKLAAQAAAKTSAAESTDPTSDADGVVKMYTEFGAAVVGADGKILAAVNDATQPNISFDEDGEITETAFKGTKMELGDDYGMVAYGNAIAEWDAQSKAFSQYVVGKTAAEVAAIETTENDHGYSVAADETLLASCTIQITGMMAVIAHAAEYAR